MADSSKATEQIEDKGKGKGGAVEEKNAGGMDVDDSSSEEEVDEVSFHFFSYDLWKGGLRSEGCGGEVEEELGEEVDG